MRLPKGHDGSAEFMVFKKNTKYSDGALVHIEIREPWDKISRGKNACEVVLQILDERLAESHAGEWFSYVNSNDAIDQCITVMLDDQKLSEGVQLLKETLADHNCPRSTKIRVNRGPFAEVWVYD